ncbi:hypothetical protein BY458DRAFT_561227 [Sporodiniella umbellata]|nr:hypothetical protein BY458DRAFT_561227 [Sporodiniella umbellata]
MSINPSTVLSNALFSIDQRVVACAVSHTAHVFELFGLVAIYVSAVPKSRREFPHNFIQFPTLRNAENDLSPSLTVDEQSEDTTSVHRLLTTGEFDFRIIPPTDPNRTFANTSTDRERFLWRKFLLAN